MNFIKDTLYSLKRMYGEAAVYIQVVSASHTISTGAVTQVLNRIPIQKIVILPSTLSEVFNKQGADYKINDRIFFIDYADIQITPAIEDYILYDGSKYVVTEATTFEYNSGYILIVRESLGSSIYDLSVNDNILLVDVNVNS